MGTFAEMRRRLEKMSESLVPALIRDGWTIRQNVLDQDCYDPNKAHVNIDAHRRDERIHVKVTYAVNQELVHDRAVARASGSVIDS